METTADSDGSRLQVDSVTGVPLDLAIAGPGGRSFAFIIDFHIRALFTIAWLFGFGLLARSLYGDAQGPPAWFSWLWLLPALLVYVLYHPVLEVVMGGRTPGKRWAGIRIVTVEGMVPGVGVLVVRNLFRFVDGLPLMYVVGLAATIATRRNQRIGDLAAGTILVYDEGVKAETLDTLPGAGSRSGLSTGEAELVHDLIDRWDTIDPEDRLGLARTLIARLDPTETGALLNDASALAALQRLLGGLR